MGVDVYQKIILERFRLDRRVREDVTRIRLGCDLAELVLLILLIAAASEFSLGFRTTGTRGGVGCVHLQHRNFKSGMAANPARILVIFLNC